VAETVLIVLLGAALAALGLTTGLWLRERRRTGRLELELREARESRPARAVEPPPPLRAVLQTAVRVRDEGLGEVLRSSLEDLAGLAEEAEPELKRLAARDGTLTIFFSDIEDSTALNEKAGDRSWLRVLEAHDKIVRRATDRVGGYFVKSQGDGFMIAFASATDAIQAAIHIQRALDSPPRALRGKGVAVRIGLHAGPALERGGDLFGRNVAFAARVADQAEGRQILATEVVRDAVAEGSGEFAFTEVGEVELKGFPDTHTLLAVDWRDA
jgi:class 3 adenylate cyclase